MMEGVTIPTINQAQKANIEKYLSEMDDDIETAKKRLEETGEYTSVADLFVNDETGLVVKEEPKPEDDPDAIIVEEEVEPESTPEVSYEIQKEEEKNYVKENKVKEEEEDKIELEDDPDDDILEKEDDKKEEEIKTTEDLKKKYEEAVVIIDKSGMGHVDFTEEERKLKKVLLML